MSVVVAIKHENRIFMACDSQITIGDYPSYGYDKIIEKNNWLIGFTGYQELDNYIRDELIICNGDSIEIITDRIKEHETNVLQDEQKNFELILAVGHEMYYIGSDFSYLEIKDNVFSIGSGGDYALGYIKGQSNEHNRIQALKTSIHVAIACDIYCGGEIIVKETDNVGCMLYDYTPVLIDKFIEESSK